MRITRVLLPVLLLGGACTVGLAQRKIVETDPGTQKSGSTNALAPAKPQRVPGGNIFDQYYRPNSVQLGPLDVPSGARSGSGSGGAAMDPILQKHLLEKQTRERNWAIYNAAKMNRNGGEVVLERRRSETEGRKLPGAQREPTAAEVQLQAVDPKYAQEYQQKLESSAGPGFDLIGRQSRLNGPGRDPNASRNPDDPRNPADPNNLGDSDEELDSAAQSRDDSDDRFGVSSSRNGLGNARVEGAVDRAASEQGIDILANGKGSVTDRLAPRLDSLRTERENELAEILGTSSRTSDGNFAGEGFAAPGRSSRMTDFQQLLASEPPTVASPKLGSEPVLAISPGPLGNPAAVSGLTRELPNFSPSSSSVNLGSAPAAGAFAPPQRLAPQPVQLPFPIRGKNGF